MKILVVLFRLLLIVLAQDKCRKEEDRDQYFIFDTITNIDVYYCLSDVQKCDEVNNSMEVTVDRPMSLFRSCTCEKLQLEDNAEPELMTVKLCKASAQINVLNGEITIAGDDICYYHTRYCYDRINSKYVYWMYIDICHYLSMIYENHFQVWTFKQNDTSFIKSDNISLLITKKIDFCGVEMRETDYKGIIVSKNATMSKKIQKYFNFSSVPPEECEITNVTSENPVKKWYIYRHPTNVTVYVCVVDSKETCEDADLGETVPGNNLNLSDHCTNTIDSSLSSTRLASNVLCKKTLKINFEENEVEELPSKCKYSDGSCKHIKIFWGATDRCSSVHKEYEGYEVACGSKKCAVQKKSSTKFTLVREGQLCGETVWYSDQDGFLVSEKELKISSSNVTLTSPSSDLFWEDYSNYKRNFIFYFLGISLLLICFNIGACSIYLCTKRRRKEVDTVTDAVQLKCFNSNV